MAVSKVLSVSLYAETQVDAGIDCAETAQPQCMEFQATKQPEVDVDTVGVAEAFGDMVASITFSDGTVRTVNLIPFIEVADVIFGKEYTPSK